ncbi:hypothetical protein HDU96_006372, partial [Phlyctochytrium bullatum]
IIITARQKHLFKEKLASATTLTAPLIQEVRKAWERYLDENLAKFLPAAVDHEAKFDALEKIVAEGKGPSPTDVPKFEMWLKAARRALAAIRTASSSLAAGSTAKPEAERLLTEAQDVLSTYLDEQLKETVTDPTIFRDYAAYWENEFFKDMDALNIRRPDVLTRVSEYVPEIIAFVEQIVKNGYGYEANGSVYFDTVRFDRDPSHFYAKLEPWSASNLKLLQEGEGDLTAKTSTGTKRNAADFALWKASKAGEPAWDSPWGKGRPGWHIECSAMSGDVLGEKLDIHAGGIDLAFPHHDNEIAQSEAHFNCRQWVNYFLHTGHLHIDGLKMSKSLKNFLTIRETLEKCTAAQLRLMFLLHSWDAVLDFKEASLQEAFVLEKAINNFITNVNAIVLEARSQPPPTTSTTHQVNAPEKDLLKVLETSQRAVHAALCDNFDTATATTTLRDLIAQANIYLRKAETERRKPSPEVLRKIAAYVTRLMRVFGVFGDANPEIGEARAGAGAGGSVEEVAGPYVRLLAAFRDKVRELARSKADPVEYLKATDQLRDIDLVNLNVALDDRDDGTALVKFVPKEVLLKEREEKREALEKARLEKEARKLKAAQEEAEKMEKGKTPPEKLFTEGEAAAAYSKWDAQGIPTHKADGEELSKSGRKKLEKQFEQHQKLHEKYLAWKAKKDAEAQK